MATERRKDQWRKSYFRNRDKIKAKVAKKKLENPALFLFYKAKHRAKKNNLPFDITVEDVVIPSVCPILGIPLIPQKDYRGEATPSLDRVIPELGYVKGNVQVISWRANRIKNDGSLHEFEMLVKYLTSI